MELTQAHYQLIKPYLPVQRGNVTIPNIRVLNAILYVAETRLQVARVAESFWQLAHHLHAHEPLGQERSARPGVRTASAKGDCEGHHRGSFTGQHLRQGASRRHGRGQKKTDHSPSASPEADGRPSFIWVAADDRTPLAFSLSPGQAHDGPEGRKLLNRLGPQRGNPPLVMDRAYSGGPNTPIGVRYGVHACCSTPEKSRGPLGV